MRLRDFVIIAKPCDLEKPRRVRCPQAAKESQSFFAATCAWRKIPLGLQLCERSECGQQAASLLMKLPVAVS